MSVSFPRKVMLFVVEIGMQVLWLIDRVTNFDARELFGFFKRFILGAIVIFSILFLGYSLYSGYLNKLAEVLFIDRISPVKNAVVYYPTIVRNIPRPAITAKSAFAIDKEGGGIPQKGKIVFEKDSNLKLAPASTVKLMTALVALNLYGPEEVLSVSKTCTEVESTKAWFPKESKYRVRDLVYSMLVGSEGDAACVLSSGKVNNGQFVDLMNKKAQELKMTSTYFSNPIGLDYINVANFSTAEDLYKLASFAVSVPVIQDAVKTPVYIVTSVDKKFTVTLFNTNKLLWEVSGTVGVKTGTTTDAGEVLIYEYKDKLKDIFIIVMGSTNRFADTKAVLDWINQSYVWE